MGTPGEPAAAAPGRPRSHWLQGRGCLAPVGCGAWDAGAWGWTACPTRVPLTGYPEELRGSPVVASLGPTGLGCPMADGH